MAEAVERVAFRSTSTSSRSYGTVGGPPSSQSDMTDRPISSMKEPDAPSNNSTAFPPRPAQTAHFDDRDNSPHQPNTTRGRKASEENVDQREMSGLRRRTIRDQRKLLPQVAFELENKGSVARDHLASERTFLAWLRTSLALASIGIAITQLFRLPASTTGTPTPPTTSTTQISEINSALAPLVSLYPQLSGLQSILEAQQLEIAQSVAKIENSTRYRHLGKPIGGTLIALALVFLCIGIYRYFSVQNALMSNPSMFPPSRRSVAFSGFCVGALVIAAFAAVLATR